MGITKQVHEQVTIKVLSGIILSIITALFTYFVGISEGSKGERQRWEQMIENAPKIYARHLDEMINEDIKKDPKQVLIKARAIVSTRDDLRKTLTSLDSLLNSEIDKLAQQIESSEYRRRNGKDLSSDELEETIAVLKRKWPSKMDQVDIEVRKLLTELGLVLQRS